MTPAELREKSQSGRISTLYAPSGVGKSSLFLTASMTNKILYIDMEGVYSQIVGPLLKAGLVNEANITAWKPDNIMEVVALAKSKEVLSYDLVGLDSVSFLTQNEYVDTRADSKDGRKVYGKLIDDFTELTYQIQKRNLQFCFICHATEGEDNNGISMNYPSTKTKKLTENMIDRSTNLFFLETTTIKDDNGDKKRVYRLHCDRFSTYAKCKKRDAEIPSLIEKEVITWQDIEKHFTEAAKEVVSDGVVKKIQKLIDEGNKLEALDMEKMFSAVDSLPVDIAELSVAQGDKMVALLVKRNAKKKEAKKISKEVKGDAKPAKK